MSAPTVVVVGAGLAGISAALAAADAGAEVVLIERRNRIGGLTWSFRRRGLWFDNGQHVFLRCCTAYREFLRRIGASEQVVLQDRLKIPVLEPGGARATIARSPLPSPLHLAPSLARYRHLSLGERARLVRPALALRRLDLADPALDEITFGAWLARHGQSPGAIQRLWNLIILPTVNVPAGEASLALAAKVFRTGLLDRADAGDLGWSAVPLAQLHAGNGGRALADAGVETVLGCRVRSVSPEPDGRLLVSTPGRDLRAGSVIVATPPEATQAVLPPGVLRPTEALGASPIVNVHLVLDRKVTDLPVAATVGSPAQFIFDRTESAGAVTGQCLSISLSAADAYIGLRPEELVRTFTTALGDLFPAARHARLVDGVVSREHAATFRGAPGTAALRPPNLTSVDGLFLAGAWCDTGWPATMEGAVRSGVGAAALAVGPPAPSSGPTARVLTGTSS
ncbi:MAG TPA: hydroxysqualene dehydroxylase HpnE [Acidimicrobiales bacterium]|nr:hydroxysqualene dehydroxylase HpnE [Acidimicrobiales bacterium]